MNLALTGIGNEWNKRSCVAMAYNAGVVKGMSGGAVYNHDDSISGVIVGFSKRVNVTKMAIFR